MFAAKTYKTLWTGRIGQRDPKSGTYSVSSSTTQTSKHYDQNFPECRITMRQQTYATLFLLLSHVGTCHGRSWQDTVRSQHTRTYSPLQNVSRGRILTQAERLRTEHCIRIAHINCCSFVSRSSTNATCHRNIRYFNDEAKLDTWHCELQMASKWVKLRRPPWNSGYLVSQPKKWRLSTRDVIQLSVYVCIQFTYLHHRIHTSVTMSVSELFYLIHHHNTRHSFTMISLTKSSYFST
jgi:hypothetical protein